MFLYMKWIKRSENQWHKEMIEIAEISQRHIKNRVQGNDTLNYSLYTDSLHKYAIQNTIAEDSLRNYFQMWVPTFRLDSARVLGISFLTRDSAKAFVIHFEGVDSKPAETLMVVYLFLKKSNLWKIESFEYLGILKAKEPIVIE